MWIESVEGLDVTVLLSASATDETIVPAKNKLMSFAKNLTY